MNNGVNSQPEGRKAPEAAKQNPTEWDAKLPGGWQTAVPRFEALYRQGNYAAAVNVLVPFAAELLKPEQLEQEGGRGLALAYLQARLRSGSGPDCEDFTLKLAAYAKAGHNERDLLYPIVLLLAAENYSQQGQAAVARQMIEFGLKAVEKVAEAAVRGLGAAVLYQYLGKLWEEEDSIPQAARCFREAQKEAEVAGDRGLEVLAQLSYAALCGDLCDSREKVDRQLIAALKAAEEQNMAGDMTALIVRGELAISLLFKGETDEALGHLNFLDVQKDYRMDKILQTAWAVAYELSEQCPYAPSKAALVGLDKAVEQEGEDPESAEAITVQDFLTSLREEWEDLGLNKHVKRLVNLVAGREWED